MNPALSRYHRLVLLPVFGVLAVARAREAATTDEDRAELTAALRCQMGGLAVWVLHGVLQVGIAIVAWMLDRSPYIAGEARDAMNLVLVVSSVLNVAAWIGEWALVLAAGLRAAAGHPYPLSRPERRAARTAQRREPSDDPPDDWKPLSDV